MSKGKLFVLSGPSGAGKSTVVNKAMENRNDICFSVSVTTRAPRKGEVDGVNYFFIDDEKFEQMVRDGELLEHAGYVNHFYGTPRAYVDKMLESGMNVILDIEIQGARQVAANRPDAVMMFIAPPSIEDLRDRLIGRGSELMTVIESRIARAREEYAEIQAANFYDYLIINDVTDTAVKELLSIIDGTEEAKECAFEGRKHILNK